MLFAKTLQMPSPTHLESLNFNKILQTIIIIIFPYLPIFNTNK